MRRREYDQDGNLISEREVWGRDATPEEQERLQAFAKQYVAEEPERRRRDRETLVRLMARYMKHHGYSQRDIDKYVRQNTRTKLEEIGITGFKRRKAK